MRLFRRCTLAAVMAAFIATPLMANAEANDDWWFDVEVVAFKRNKALTELEEQFKLAESFDVAQTEADVIGAVIMPDIRFIKQNLATCDINGLPEKTPLPAWPEDLNLLVPSHDADFLVLDGSEMLDKLDRLDDFNESTDVDSSAASDYPASLGEEYESTDLEGSDLEGADLENTDLSGNDFRDNNLKNSDFTKSSEPSDSDIAPSLEAITSYWIDINWTDFIGDNTEPKVSIPQFTYCETHKPWLSINQQPNGIKWVRNGVDNSMPAPQQLPVVIEGNDWPLASKAHLLTSDSQELTSISRQIRSNRELERLLHVAWRQPVKFGKNKAFNVRLFGGTNYASSFNEDGEQLKDKRTTVTDTVNTAAEATVIVLNEDEQMASSTFFSSLEQRLLQPEPISFKTLERLDSEGNLSVESTTNNGASRKPICEIDCRMKVFLKYINRVPYLHIDSEMFYRHQVPTQYFTGSDLSKELASSNSRTLLNDDGENSVLENSLSETDAQTVEYQLVSIPLAEQRRVISKQLHYFDHPLYGFIVQIRRYERPLQAARQNDTQHDTQK
jgi:uncharacterized protein YjbI with pentapeptide repeats